MSFSPKSIWFTSFAVMLVLATTDVYATNVGAPKHPSSGVGVPGTPTPKRTANSAQLSTSEWTITLLSSATGLIPQQVSRDGKIVLLKDGNNPTTFYRWSEGSTETLGIGSNFADLNFNEAVGTLLINNGNVVLDPALNAGTFRPAGAYMNNTGTIVLEQNVEGGTPQNGNGYNISTIKLFQPTDSSASLVYTPELRTVSHFDSYSGTSYVTRDQSADVILVDDQNKTWFRAEDSNEHSTWNTINQNYSLQTLPYYVYAVSRNGHYILLANRYYVDGNPVEFNPAYINENGTVLAYDPAGGYNIVLYSNGQREIIPPGVAALTLDNQDRLNGWSFDYAGSPPFLFLKKLGTDGQPLSPVQYEKVSYVPLAFPTDSGWTTNQVVAPGTIAPQIGIAVNTSTGARVPFVATPNIRLAVDASRDGVISSDGSDDTSAALPYRFWINDDVDSGDTGGNDIPGQAVQVVNGYNGGPDYVTNVDPSGRQLGVVNGARDLVDLFPVSLDIKQLLAVLPPSASVKYKLKQADGALNFVYTNLTRDHAFDYQRVPQDASPLTSGFGPSLAQAPASASKQQVTAAGVDLFGDVSGSPQFLDAVQNHNGGVILVEGRATTSAPLVLAVEKNGNVIAEVKLELNLAPVETMFRHLNLHDRNLAGLVGAMPGGTARPEAMGDPTGFPDDPNSDSRWLIFVHGFNVSGQGSRGWNAEMFKRCYWSGNKSRFVGVSWFGNPDQVLGAVSDYHEAVRNAMVTAPVFAQEINALAGAADTKTIFAHSLGCGLISSAIVDNHMAIGRVCFVDAALARECFDGRDPNAFTSENDGMTPAVWKPYITNKKLFAANWYARFESSDTRATVTWNSRFTSASSVVYNFYSSTEDVLAAYTGELPTSFLLPGGVLWTGDHLGVFGWVYQEKGKGNRQDYLLALTEQGVTGLTHLGSYYGGWGMNLKDPVLSGDTPYWKWINSEIYIGRVIKTPAEIGTVSDSVLRRYPMFEPGWGKVRNQEQQENPVSDVSPVDGAPSWIYNLYLSSGNTLTSNADNRSRLLAEAIPSLTWCLGSRQSESAISSDRNFNLPKLVDQTNWPRGKPDGVTPEWRHSDMREVAYLYQYRVFEKIVALSKP